VQKFLANRSSMVAKDLPIAVGNSPYHQ
jgi:hypothetical protein